MTPEELDRLLAIARAATPGPWSSISDYGRVYSMNPQSGIRGLDIAHVCHYRDGYEDAAHIAAFSPEVVIALIEELRAAQEVVAHYESHCDGCDNNLLDCACKL